MLDIVSAEMADDASRDRASYGGRGSHGGRSGRGGRGLTISSAPGHVSSTGPLPSTGSLPMPDMGSTPATSTTSATESTSTTQRSCTYHGGMPFEPGTVDPTDGRIWIRPAGILDFDPPGLPASAISKLFRGKYDQSWPTWSTIEQNVRDVWFEEFGLRFRWLPSDEAAIRKAFESRGSRLVKNVMNKIRSGQDNGDWMYPHVLEGLRKYWAEDPKFLHKSAIGKQNRGKDPTAPRYTGGSRSISGHFKKLKQDFQRDPTAYEIMEKTKKSKNGVWINDKSARVAGTFHRLREEADSQGQDHSISFDNDLFFKAVGGKNKKGYVYGLGRMSDDFTSSSIASTQSVSSATVDCREVIQKLNEELYAKNAEVQTMRTRMDAQDAKIERLFRMLQASSSGSGHQEHDDEDADDSTPLPSPTSD